MLKTIQEFEPDFRGKRITLQQHLVETDSGKRFKYEIAKVQDAVAILPVLDDGSVVLIKTYRYPIGNAYGEDEGWSIEVPAGLLEVSDKNREHRARQELKEETGYVCLELEQCGMIYTSAGMTNERVYLYEARKLTPGVQELEPAEAGTQVMVVPFQDIELLVGEVSDAKTKFLLTAYLYNTLRAGAYL